MSAAQSELSQSLRPVRTQLQRGARPAGSSSTSCSRLISSCSQLDHYVLWEPCEATDELCVGIRPRSCAATARLTLPHCRPGSCPPRDPLVARRLASGAVHSALRALQGPQRWQYGGDPPAGRTALDVGSQRLGSCFHALARSAAGSALRVDALEPYLRAALHHAMAFRRRAASGVSFLLARRALAWSRRRPLGLSPWSRLGFKRAQQLEHCRVQLGSGAPRALLARSRPPRSGPRAVPAAWLVTARAAQPRGSRVSCCSRGLGPVDALQTPPSRGRACSLLLDRLGLRPFRFLTVVATSASEKAVERAESCRCPPEA